MVARQSCRWSLRVRWAALSDPARLGSAPLGGGALGSAALASIDDHPPASARPSGNPNPDPGRTSGGGAQCSVQSRLSLRERACFPGAPGKPTLFRNHQTLRFLGGRQPLWGRGVTSSIALIESPDACKAVIALSRPEPGPLTFTSTSLTPYLVAVAAAVSAARCAANGVLLRLPLNPTVPDEAQQRASDRKSVG